MKDQAAAYILTEEDLRTQYNRVMVLLALRAVLDDIEKEQNNDNTDAGNSIHKVQ